MTLLYRCRRLQPPIAVALTDDDELVDRLKWGFSGLSATAVLGEELRKALRAAPGSNRLAPLVDVGDVWALRRLSSNHPCLDVLLSMSGEEVGTESDTGRARLQRPTALETALRDAAAIDAVEVQKLEHSVHAGHVRRANDRLDPELSLIEDGVLRGIVAGRRLPEIASDIGFSEAMVEATLVTLGEKLELSVEALGQSESDGGLGPMLAVAREAVANRDWLLGWYALADS